MVDGGSNVSLRPKVESPSCKFVWDSTSTTANVCFSKMYFTLARRKTLARILTVSLTFLAILFIFTRSQALQQRLCPDSAESYGFITSICPLSHELRKGFNILEHLGGNGPWFARKPESDLENLPMKCHVDQVHMISRHAERYPTRNAGIRHFALLEKMKAPEVVLSGSLRFVRDWNYFTPMDNPAFENLTDSGPFAGTRQAYNTGHKLRERYSNLVDPNKTTNFWTCESGRDVETAKHFADGFFGQSWATDSLAKLHVIPEAPDRGADTLTPGDTCLKYIEDKENGHDLGYAKLGEWQDIFTKEIAERLQKDAGGLVFSPIEIYGMMEICGFEILATGHSPWCHIFTEKEWLDFEYGRDLLHFYRAGPGNDFAGAIGWLWLNATSDLLANDAARGVYFSFVHDGDIIPLLATLGILDEGKQPGSLPSDKVKTKRKWKTSDVVPMGGRLIFERVTCDNTGLGANLRRSYVRLFINDGLVNLDKSFISGGLANGVGLKQWLDTVAKKEEKFGRFKDVCGLPDRAPSRITFLQPQYKS